MRLVQECKRTDLDYETGARVQKDRSGLPRSSANISDILIVLLALSKEIRQATFPRDGGPQNGAHRFWRRDKCKRKNAKKSHLPNKSRA